MLRSIDMDVSARADEDDPDEAAFLPMDDLRMAGHHSDLNTRVGIAMLRQCGSSICEIL